MARKLGFVLLVLCFFSVTALTAQEAVVKVHVEPEQAFIFVDNQPVGEGAHTLKLTQGKHTIGVYNYGFKPMIKEVDLASGTGNEDLRFYLEAAGGPVSGPSWGVIQIEGAPRAAVLLNGKAPEYFVGNGDMTNNHIWWKQQLIVPAGTHEVTVNYKGQDLYSGKVEVGAHQRVIIHVDRNGEIVTKSWKEGERMTSAPRFRGGVASATVAVAPITGTFAADPKGINCNEKAKLAWNTTETLHTAIASDSETFPELAQSGQEMVSPKKTTTYHFKTSGPGGIIESTDTVNVNPEVKANLNKSPEDVHYLRIGDKVIVQDHATLTWDVSNADNVTLEPFGTVNANGSNTVSPTPTKDTPGAVEETHSYKLTASNVCGGSDTKVADVRLVGNIEPSISSLFFPTGYPARRNPKAGLLKSQKERLATIATVFKLYMEHVTDAKLDISGFADPRGPKSYNKNLSTRRATIVKDFLVAQGIPDERITMEGKGESTLSLDVVKSLETQNPQPPDPKWLGKPRATRLAYNRRADVAIMPAALESARFFPHAADDSALLMSPKVLGSKNIQKAGE